MTLTVNVSTVGTDQAHALMALLVTVDRLRLAGFVVTLVLRGATPEIDRWLRSSLFFAPHTRP